MFGWFMLATMAGGSYRQAPFAAMSLPFSLRICSSSWLLAVALGVCALPFRAAAQSSNDADRATARELGKQGLVALDQGEFATADDRLSRAIALHDVPTLRLARAQARRSLGHLISAGEDFRAVIRVPRTPHEPSVFEDARRDARNELANLEPLVPRLTLALEGGAATIRVDGSEWPQATIGIARPIDPGEYVVDVLPKTGSPSRYKLRIEPGEQRVITLRAGGDTPPADGLIAVALPASAAREQVDDHASEPHAKQDASAAAGEARAEAILNPGDRPAPARESGRDNTAAWIVTGTAAALAVGAIVTGALYLFKYKSDYDAANERPGNPQAASLRKRASTMSLVSGVLWGGAAVTGGVGAYLLLSAPGEESVAHARNQASPLGRTELGITGRF